METKNFLTTVLTALIGGLVAVFSYVLIFDNNDESARELTIQPKEDTPAWFTNLPDNFDAEDFDFTLAAENTVHAVVHVKTESQRQQSSRNPLYEFFYGDQYQQQEPRPVVGFGSGVIISPDGYIVTNNHVVANSNNVSVTLNDNREFDAEIIGTDPSTDIALLKVDEEALPYVRWGNSDDLKLGEWVLAVGNPFNLTSTVTAGIVSAKGRNLGILREEFRIESFIQTDAALNKGNSGGALVDTKGLLVGINTAIISPSGGYAGNSFAVPVSIVKKVVNDLKEFGEVQRAILGVTIQDVTSELKTQEDLETLGGVYISGVREDGAAEDAGIKAGDVIISVEGNKVNSTAELQEQVSRYRPGDEVEVVIRRDGKEKTYEVTLRNLQGTTNIVKPDETTALLGARFSELSDQTKEAMNISDGVEVSSVGPGKFREAGIREGFIITKVNEKKVSSPSELKSVLEAIDGGVYIEGIYTDGRVAYYAFGM